MNSEEKKQTAPQEPEYFGDDIEISEDLAEGQFLSDGGAAEDFYEDGEMSSAKAQKKLAGAEYGFCPDRQDKTAPGKPARAELDKPSKAESDKPHKAESDKPHKAESDKPHKAKPDCQAEALPPAPIRSWFCTFMIMNLPIIGWIYLLILALRKKGDQRKDFAKAYLVYKLVFLIVALAILAVLLYFGLEMADNLLEYMEML